MSFERLSEGQLDALKEISNIGMGHAATALSQLVGDRVDLRVPKITVADIDKVPDFIGGAEKVVVGVVLQVLGGARGSILLIFPRESAFRLLSILLGREEEGETLSELASSTLGEVGNILASAYLGALGNLLGMTLIPSVPLLAHDMAGAIVDHILIELSRTGDQALIVETEFIGKQSADSSVKGHFLLLPDPDSLDLVLQAAGGVS